MSIFGFGKNKKVEESKCDCGKVNSEEVSSERSSLENKQQYEVKILGSGCKKCNDLEAATVEALKELGMDSSVEHVTDFTEIASYGVMSTPAIVLDGKVLSFGKVLSKNEVIALIKKVRG